MSENNEKREYQGKGDKPRGGGYKGAQGGGRYGRDGGKGGDRKPYRKDGDARGGRKFDRDGKPRKFDDRKEGGRYNGESKGGERKFERRDGDRKFERRDGDRPYKREDGERKPYRDSKPGGKRDWSDKPRGERKWDDKPRGERSFKREDGDGEKRSFERRDGARKFDDRKGGKSFDGRKGVGRERKFEHRDDERDFKRRDDERGFSRSRDDRKFEDGERKFNRREFGEKLERDQAEREDAPRKDYKFGATPKEQARKGYQGRKGRANGHCASPARIAALEVVAQLRRRDAFAQELISKRVDKSDMSAEDRAFATKLVLGVVSTRGTLDDILNRCMNTPDDVSDAVRDALQISAYEIMYLEKEAHAAVDQGVELVRTVAPAASGVANAVLRKLVSIKDEFPFGDAQRELPAFARAHAFPEWLARELVETFGPDGAHAFMETCNDPAPVFVALNAAKEGEAEALQTLAAAKGEPQAGVVGESAIAGCYKIATGQVLTDGRIKRLINNGHILVSDLASQAVANLVLPEEKPASMLEIGAGRATKTILIQSNAKRRWGSQIEEYVTLDNHEFKTNILTERAEQYGIHVSEAVTGDATDLDSCLAGRTFDVVFIDAPCTGLGTLRRHPEIRWRLKPATIDEYAELGLSMLKQAAAHVNPGGTLAYATCTVTRKENSGVIKAFLESPEGANFRLVPIDGKAAFASELTAGGSDAHFAAKMVRVD